MNLHQLGLGIALAAASLVLSACPGSANDNGLDENEPLCTANLTMTGTLMTATGTPPPADQGCVPQGTWKVTVAIADQGGCPSVPVKTNYDYTVTGAGPDQRVAYANPAANEEMSWNITAGGNGSCEGAFDHVLPADGGKYHLISLRPYFDKGTVQIKGGGSYELWARKP